MRVADVIARERKVKGIAPRVVKLPMLDVRSAKPLLDCDFSLAVFENLYATIPEKTFIDRGWSFVVEALIGDSALVRKDKTLLPFFCPVELRDAAFVGKTLDREIANGGATVGKQRSKNHIDSASFLAIDVDDVSEDQWDGIQEALTAGDLAFAAFSTFNHGVVPGLVRVRVLLPLDRKVSRTEYKKCWLAADALLLGGQGDEASAKPEQAAGLWGTHPDRLSKAFKIIQHGSPLAVTALLKVVTPNKPPKGALLDGPKGTGRATPLRLVSLNSDLQNGVEEGYTLPEAIHEGGRNAEFLRYAGSLRGKGHSEDDILDMVRQANRERCNPPLDDAEIVDVVSRFANKPAMQSVTIGSNNPSAVVDDESGSQVVRAADNGKTLDTTKARKAIAGIGPVAFDQSGVPRLICEIGKRLEALDLNGGHARDHFIAETFKITGKTIGKDTLDREIALLRAGGRVSDRIQTNIRVAELNGAFFLDLNNADGAVVRVVPGTWSIEHNPKGLYFLRDDKTGELPVPVHAGSIRDAWGIIDEFFTLLGIEESLRLLLFVAICEWLRPSTPFPVIELLGVPGGGKSTAAKLLINLIDPSASGGLPEVSSIESKELGPVAARRWLLTSDNQSKLSGDEQDLLCKTSTGVELNARSLYTNSDTVSLSIARPFVITAVNPVITRSDLSDRALRFVLPPRHAYMTTADILLRAKDERPKVLGALLDIFATALHELPRVAAEIQLQHRLADYVLLGESVFAAIGRRLGDFSNAFRNIKHVQADDVLEGDAVGRLIVEAVKTMARNAKPADQLPARRGWWDKPQWAAIRIGANYVVVARSKALLHQIRCLDNAQNDMPSTNHLDRMPGTARALASTITRLQPLLRDSGIQVVVKEVGGRKNRAFVFVFPADQMPE